MAENECIEREILVTEKALIPQGASEFGEFCLDC